MALVQVKCTHCGENLKAESTEYSAVCEHCGTLFIVEKAMNDYNEYINNIKDDFVIENGVLTEYIGKAKKVVIPNTVTVIAAYAFDECNDVTSIVIPDSVEEINSYSFNNCVNLTDVSIPESIEELNRETFNGCKNITSLKIAGHALINFQNDKDDPVLPADVNTNKFFVMNRILKFLQREFDDDRALYINGFNLFDMQNMKEIQDKRVKSKRRKKITAPIGWTLAGTGAVIAFIGLFSRLSSGGDLSIFFIGMGVFIVGCIFTAVN